MDGPAPGELKETDNEYSTLDNHVFYRDRPKWKDLKPISQNDLDEPVVQIAYSDECEYNFRIFASRINPSNSNKI